MDNRQAQPAGSSAQSQNWLQRPRVLLLRDVVRLRVLIESLLQQKNRQGEDIYAQQYNDLAGWALAEFPHHPCLTPLVRMPDAVTQVRPDLGLERLRAHIRRLESCLINLLGIDPTALPELKQGTVMDTLKQIKPSVSTFSIDSGRPLAEVDTAMP